jgi:hypothetical protein
LGEEVFSDTETRPAELPELPDVPDASPNRATITLDPTTRTGLSRVHDVESGVRGETEVGTDIFSFRTYLHSRWATSSRDSCAVVVSLSATGLANVRSKDKINLNDFEFIVTEDQHRYWCPWFIALLLAKRLATQSVHIKLKRHMFSMNSRKSFHFVEAKQSPLSQRIENFMVHWAKNLRMKNFCLFTFWYM